jgi:cytochrome c-type biogenesis protein CcmH
MHWKILLACSFVAGAAWAIDPEPPLDDPIVDAEYQQLIREVRCLVCQNQPISDSSAPLAADLRREIRRMFEEGSSRAEIEEFLIARYGDFVLYRPQLKPMTWALWGAPFVLLLIGGAVFARILRARMSQPITEDYPT